MKITRKVTFKTNDICIGDQITVNLGHIGKFTATVQRITDENIVFMFDEILWETVMDSNINAKLSTLAMSFPKKLRERLIEVYIPSYGEIFGHDYEPEYYEKFEPDNNTHFEIMKNVYNRVCAYNNKIYWWWLSNKKRNVSATAFALVSTIGLPTYGIASVSYGVRPVFVLKKNKEEE